MYTEFTKKSNPLLYYNHALLNNSSSLKTSLLWCSNHIPNKEVSMLYTCLFKRILCIRTLQIMIQFSGPLSWVGKCSMRFWTLRLSLRPCGYGCVFVSVSKVERLSSQLVRLPISGIKASSFSQKRRGAYGMNMMRGTVSRKETHTNMTEPTDNKPILLTSTLSLPSTLNELPI